MTDKELKDWCKTCSVEPPAMKFKCPECEHNPDKEQIICKYKFRNKEKFDGKPYCTCFNELCEDLSFVCDNNCQIYEDFKQLARKAQECENLKEDYQELEQRHNEAFQDFKQLKQEYEGLKRDLQRGFDSFLKQKEELFKEIKCYRKALEEIEEIAKDGLNPICYKSNCSRCKCYNGDDCKAGMISLINNYFTENGEFADGNGDFAEALEDLLDKERSRCNRALPISKKILDIINKAKGEE